MSFLEILPESGYEYWIFRVSLILTLTALITWAALKIVVPSISSIIDKTAFKWDDQLIENRFFARISYIVPVISLNWLTSYLISTSKLADSGLDMYLNKLTSILVISVVGSVLFSLVDTVRSIFQSKAAFKNMPIDNFRQLLKLTITVVCLVLVVSAILGKSPTILLTGLSAFAAILMLIGKDVILGFVGGIQLSLNGLVQIGDWIEYPKGGVDGDVISVGLTTIKVRNFDKTISSIPTYDLMQNVFKNWRGMSDAGGRRIKRQILIDQSSCSFLSNEQLQKLKQVEVLKEYFKEKEAQKIALASEQDEIVANGRRLTNIGTFRKYIEYYLKHHPQIRQDMTLLVRQLEATSEGLPIQIYCFTVTDWLAFEQIQSDIFDHLICVAPLFNLRLYQKPTGFDFAKLQIN